MRARRVWRGGPKSGEPAVAARVETVPGTSTRQALWGGGIGEVGIVMCASAPTLEGASALAASLPPELWAGGRPASLDRHSASWFLQTEGEGRGEGAGGGRPEAHRPIASPDPEAARSSRSSVLLSPAGGVDESGGPHLLFLEVAAGCELERELELQLAALALLGRPRDPGGHRLVEARWLLHGARCLALQQPLSPFQRYDIALAVKRAVVDGAGAPAPASDGKQGSGEGKEEEEEEEGAGGEAASRAEGYAANVFLCQSEAEWDATRPGVPYGVAAGSLLEALLARHGDAAGAGAGPGAGRLLGAAGDPGGAAALWRRHLRRRFGAQGGLFRGAWRLLGLVAGRCPAAFAFNVLAQCSANAAAILLSLMVSELAGGAGAGGVAVLLAVGLCAKAAGRGLQNALEAHILASVTHGLRTDLARLVHRMPDAFFDSIFLGVLLLEALFFAFQRPLLALTERHTARRQALLDALLGVAGDMLRGQAALKAFASPRLREAFDRAAEQLRGASRRTYLVSSGASHLMMACNYLLLALTILALALLAEKGLLTPASGVLVYTSASTIPELTWYFSCIFPSIVQCHAPLNRLEEARRMPVDEDDGDVAAGADRDSKGSGSRRGGGGGGRGAELEAGRDRKACARARTELELELEAGGAPAPPQPPEPLEVALRGVRFVYRPLLGGGPERAALDGVTLDLPARAHVCIVGPSGGGKSTLLKVLRGDLPPSEGAVLFGGAPLSALPPHRRRRLVCSIGQEPFLFSDTLAENVRIGRPGASDAEVAAACAAVRLDGLAAGLPFGYQTPVSSKVLSGGQCKRVAFARAILSRAPIVLLDEVSSGLDTETEAAIGEVVRHFVRTRTVVEVTHRLHRCRGADLVVVVRGGRVAEQGTHAALLAAPDALYRRMWELEQGGGPEFDI
eukprot:tig00020960_g16555.t1